MKTHFRRVSLLIVAAVIAALAPVVPAHASSNTCDRFYDSDGKDRVLCNLDTYGYSSYTGAYGTTGWVIVSLRFSSSGTKITSNSTEGYSRLTVYDTWQNGRGVVVQMNAHKRGTPADNNSDNYISLGSYKDGGEAGADYNLPQVYWSTGIDFVYLNYADSYDGCYYCYVGTWTIYNPYVPGAQ